MQGEIDLLIKQRIELIEENKNSYKILKQNSKAFYANSIEKQKELNERYKLDYKKILNDIEENKKTILELNERLMILEKRKTLYLSGVYQYNSGAVLYITPISKEEYIKFKEENKGKDIKKGGFEYDLEYIDNISNGSEDESNNYYSKIKKEIKKRSKKEDRKSLIYYLKNSF